MARWRKKHQLQKTKFFFQIGEKMLTAQDIDKIVSRITKISVEAIHSDETKREISNPRAMAMLKCKEFLKWGTVKTRKHYNKDSHTTVMSALKTITSLINTDQKFKDMSIKIDAAIRKRQAYYIQKERYNLNYRIRQKNYTLDHKSKTVSINPGELSKLEKRQVAKLIKKHNYKIQYTLF